MKRLTNDNPQDNVSSALNLFYVKDGWTWVRGGGPGPDYADISLNNYIRMIASDHGLEIAKSSNEDEISCEMAELLFDGTSTVEGIIATLYTAGWAFAELRERLKMYEDTMSLQRAKELAQAEKDGRLVVLEPVHTAKEGAEKPACFYNDMGQEFCLGFGLGREDDEPIDKCKECWYCEFSLVREEAEAALKKREEADNEAD